MIPTQIRLRQALRGVRFEDQVGLLGFEIVLMLATGCSSPLDEFDRLVGDLRLLLQRARTDTTQANPLEDLADYQ
jgi:hypothetical protein